MWNNIEFWLSKALADLIMAGVGIVLVFAALGLILLYAAYKDWRHKRGQATKRTDAETRGTEK